MKPAALILLGALTLFAAGEYSNRRAPGFSLADSHFEQHDPQDYHGKVLIIDFMQTKCPICIQLADELLHVKAKYGDKVAILSITTLPDNFQTAQQFATDHKILWPILFDSGQVMMSYLKVTPANPTVHFPHLFIIDGNGTIRYDFESGLDANEISAQVDKLLK
ncbi:MAG TPA: TlpA disulfide reductase family protein [Bryobacteraceae bacterium]|jgi:peroxiredoxin